ncbi:MAG: flagellar biosynthesis protein FliQ [Gammaproteobacteria bacterium]|nr:flagellar biosynthesis protein FliQ [Gammaproteobacteria bacterium]
MNSDYVITLGHEALMTTVLISAPLLLSALLIGLLVGMFQAATQINEMTLSFIPKLLVLVLVLMFTGPWLLMTITSYSTNLISSVVPLVIGSR